jgi:hypothetical protein
MLWVALATAIMMLTGEFYDARAIAKLFLALREVIVETVAAEPQRARALRAVGRFEQAFEQHRKDLEAFTACVERADLDYRATRDAYAACENRAQAQRQALRRTLDDVEREYAAALAPEEHARVLSALTARPEARALHPALVAEAAKARVLRRSRGIEGVVAQRHLTLPRNVASIVFGPLPPSTFGQRYPSTIIDAGTSYARHEGAASAAAHEEVYTRIGLRLGLFDDFEAGVLLPFRLAPELEFDPALVVLTEQLRLEGVDIALRVSFHTPGDTGWAVAPGTLLKLRGRRVALLTGVFAPMELGTFEEPRKPLGGLNLPLRLAWNLVPSVFVTAESGVAYDDLDRPHGLTVPLGFGAGYSRLVGSELLEFTGSFAWDHFLLPAPAPGQPQLRLEDYRVALGATFFFRML